MQILDRSGFMLAMTTFSSPNREAYCAQNDVLISKILIGQQRWSQCLRVNVHAIRQKSNLPDFSPGKIPAL